MARGVESRLDALEDAARQRQSRRPTPSRRLTHPAAHSLEAFVRHTMPEYEWNWHHRLICDRLEALERGDIRRLMVFAPPRSGKSQLVSIHFPAWAIGLNPDWPVMAGTHSNDLVSTMCQKVQDLIDTPEYREVFPGVTIGGARRRRTQRVFQMGDSVGVYRGAGTKTRISGFGFKLGILDDPIGDDTEAYSEAHRKRLWNWYNTTFRARKNADARILLTVTRWHADDLPGRLLALSADDPRADQWEVVRLPAIAEGPDQRHPKDPRQEGEPIWPARKGQFDLEGITADRASMPPFHFQALMQQRPTAAEGAQFKTEWFGTWTEEGTCYRTRDGKLIQKAACWRLTVLDPASSESSSADYTAIGTYAIAPTGDIFVLDMVRERLPLDRIAPRLKLVWDLYRPLYVAVEGVGFQKAVGNSAQQLLPNVAVRLVEPQGRSKLIRAVPAVVRAAAGKIHLPAPAPAWVRLFLEELSAFTGNEDLHDDMVDTLSYAVQLAGDVSESTAMPISFGAAPSTQPRMGRG